MSDTTEKFVFDWHAQGVNFVYWLLPTLLSSMPDATVSQLSEMTDGFRNVDMTIMINGVPVNTKAFLEGVDHNMKYHAELAAQQMVSEMANLDELADAVRETEMQLLSLMRSKLMKIGVDLPEQEE